MSKAFRSTDTEPVWLMLPLINEHPHWHVFPIKAGAKHPPLFERNLELASNDPAVIRRWAKIYPGCNWGLALKKSGVIVMDVDGDRGRNTLECLELEHGRLPPTLSVRTPNGGEHYYFHTHTDITHRMRVGAFGPGIDSTNYVLMPGSILRSPHPTLYKPNTSPRIVAPAPAWFAEYLDAPMIGDNSQAPAVEQDTPDLIAWAIHYLKYDAPPSTMGRNGEFTLLMVAGCLKDHGISESTAVELLAEHYNVRCEPPWDIGEGATADRLDVKVANAWAYLKQTQPGAHTAQVAFSDDVVDSAALDALVEWWKQHDNEDAFCLIGGKLYPKG